MQKIELVAAFEEEFDIHNYQQARWPSRSVAHAVRFIQEMVE